MQVLILVCDTYRKVRKIIKRLIGIFIIATLALALNFSTISYINALPEDRGSRALAEKLIVSRGWDELPIYDELLYSYEKLISSSRIYKAEEVVDLIDKRLKAIIVNSEVSSPYYEDRRVYLVNAKNNHGIIVHETIHALSLYYSPFIFRTPHEFSVGNIKVYNTFFLEGITDFFAYRAIPEFCQTNNGTVDFEPAGTISYWATSCENKMTYPIEYGLTVPFMYASGSLDFEKAFFQKEEGVKFQKDFDNMHGEGKLRKTITNATELAVYYKYINKVIDSKDKETAFNKTKEYIDNLISLLERRSTQISSADMLNEYIYDLDMFRKSSLEVSDLVFMESINKRLTYLENYAKDLREADIFKEVDSAPVASTSLNPAQPDGKIGLIWKTGILAAILVVLAAIYKNKVVNK